MEPSDYCESYTPTPRDYATLAALEYQDSIANIPTPPRRRKPKPKDCYPNLHRSSNQKIRNHQTKYTSETFTSSYSGHDYEIKCDENKPVILESLEAGVIQFEKCLGYAGSMKIIAFTVFSRETKRGQSESNRLMRSLRGKFGPMAYFKIVEVNREGAGKHYAIMIGIPLADYKRGTTIKAIHKSWANISNTAVHIDKTYEVRSLEDLAQPVAYLSYNCKVRTKAFDRKGETFYSTSRLKQEQLEQLYDMFLGEKERWISDTELETPEPAPLKASKPTTSALKQPFNFLISNNSVSLLPISCKWSTKTNRVSGENQRIHKRGKPEKLKRAQAEHPNINIQRIVCTPTGNWFSWYFLEKIRIRQPHKTRLA